MTTNAHIRTSVATLMGSALVDTRGQTIGRVSEFAVSPMEDSGYIRGVLVRLQGSGRKAKPSLVPISALHLTDAGAMQLLEDVSSLLVPGDDEFLLLERDLLDQQIIDVHGHKVVRVNDVELVWEP